MILIVDDDTLTRRMTVTALNRQGFEVLDARQGAPALALLTSQQLEVDLLVTDIDTRGMSGLELAAQARALRPTLPLLFVSGRYHEEFTTMTAADTHTRCLGKPYSGAALVAKVCELLLLEGERSS